MAAASSVPVSASVSAASVFSSVAFVSAGAAPVSAAVLPQPASIVVAIAALSNTLISFFFIALPLFLIDDRRFSQRNSCLLLSR